jgi:hypothetical protein
MAPKPKPVRIPRSTPKPPRAGIVYQFLIALAETDPLVWRRIQVPERYSFWDLHVAIQDAMGWQDYHLHEFRVVHPKRKQLDLIGIPDRDFPDERPCQPSWQVAVSKYVDATEQPALYVYDFGDNWRHIVMYEGVSSAEPEVVYPRCTGGARACPPEDCGGVDGYAEFLRAIADPKHPEHASMVQWSGGRYDADAFDPGGVVFDDPRKRWTTAFGGGVR